MLKIGWKSFGNRWPCFEVIENLSTPSVIFGSQREIFSNLRKLSENLWGSLEIFRNLWKQSVNLRKFRFCGDEKSHAFYWKKVCRYTYVLYGTACAYKRIVLESHQGFQGLFSDTCIPTNYHSIYRSKIVISGIQTSFSHPTDNSVCNCLKTD